MAEIYGCNKCANVWQGHSTAHCGACHETFTTLTVFDMHRKGTYEPDTRHCETPQSVGLVKSNRGYPCWQRPGAAPVDGLSRRQDRDLSTVAGTLGVAVPEGTLTRA
jgi:hypothetical protein